MNRTTLRWLSVLAVLGLLGSFFASWGDSQEESKQLSPAIKEFLQAKPIQVQVGADALRVLQVDQRNVALVEVQMRILDCFTLRAPTELEVINLGKATLRLLDAEVVVAPTAKARIDAHDRHVFLAKCVEELAVRDSVGGRIQRANGEYGRHLRINAEIRLLQAKKAENVK